MFKWISEASRLIAGAEDLLWPGKMPTAQLAVLYPRSSFLWDGHTSGPKPGVEGPHGGEDMGYTAMDYLAVINGLFRRISQDANIQIDFIDEDALNEHDLSPYKALILTEPDIPLAGQSAVVKWMKAGGNLMTVSGAAVADEYATPSAVISAATGIAEAPRTRMMIEKTSELSVVANATGELGSIQAYGVRGNIIETAKASTTLAKFSDGSPAIVRSGSATHFAFLPCIYFNNTDPYHGSKDWDDDSTFADGSLSYIKQFLKDAGVTPRVQVSIDHVETPLISSANGSVLTLLNWRDAPANAMQVAVLVQHDVQQVTAVATASQLKFNCTKSEDSWLVSFVVDVEHADMVRLDAVKTVVPIAKAGVAQTSCNASFERPPIPKPDLSLSKSNSSFDSWNMFAPFVTKIGSQWMMYYSGGRDTKGADAQYSAYHIGLGKTFSFVYMYFHNPIRFPAPVLMTDE